MTLPMMTCPHRPPCPGCPRFGETLLGHDALDRLSELASESGIVPVLAESTNPRGYRVRARLAVRGRASAPHVGIFEEGSHRVVDIPGCVVHDPLVNDVAIIFKQTARELAVPPYADALHRGLLRYLQVVVERASQSVQIVVVANSEDARTIEPLVGRIAEHLGERLQGAFFSPNVARSNVILGPRCDKLLGSDAVRERIAGADVFFPPDAFGQSNLDGYERIVGQIGRMVGDGVRVLELYAGTGAIGLSLLPRASQVTFNELAPGSLRGLRMGLDALPPALRARAEVAAGPVAEHVALASEAEVVVADPPRKGLDPALLSALCATPPERLIYLSCGLDSFLRDAHALLGTGKLRLRELIVHDLFPFTGHVETLALFTR